MLLYVSNVHPSKLIKTDGTDYSTQTVTLESSKIFFHITVAYNRNEQDTHQTWIKL